MSGTALEKPVRGPLTAGALLLAAAIFLADLRLPAGAAVPSLYAAVVLLGLWSPGRRFAVAAALLASLLTALGALLAPDGPSPWTAAVNRSTALMLTWLTALGVVRYKGAERGLMAGRERDGTEAAPRPEPTLAQLGELAAVVAHEVRNPLAGIRATIQVLSKRLPATDGATVKALFARIDALNEMTENLLLFARPRPLQLSALPLKPLLREAADLLTRAERWSSTVVDIAGDEVCARADALALRGVFLNLLLNAAEAMGGAGTVRVSIAAADSTCRVSISDSGPGIPPELRERVFEPFFTTRHRGTGLGLAIVRRQVELHAGEVSVSCPAGGGTTVTVRLPLQAPVAAE